MAGLIDRIGSLAGTDLGKAVDLAHRFYQERMGVHSHTGRAIIETAAEVARNHPNLVGIGAGLLVEQFLSEQKRRHDIHLAELEGEAEAGGARPAPPSAAAPKSRSPNPGEPIPGAPNPGAKAPRHDFHVPLVHHDFIQLHALRPGRVALEVFGALALLKLASSGMRWFRHDHQHEAWFAPAARIRLWSGSIAAYYLVKSLKSPKVSAWRNGAIALFATDALKPVLKAPKRRKGTSPPQRPTPPALTRPAAPFAAPAPLAPVASTPPAEAYASAPSTAHDPAPPPAQHSDAPALH